MARPAASPRFRALKPNEAQGKAGELLRELAGRHGQVTPMVATMANSPAVLAGYLGLTRAMKRSTLDRRLSERVSIAAQARLGCETCLEAHSSAAAAIGLSDAEIAAARDAISGEPRIADLLKFAMLVLTEPAAVDETQIAILLDHGYSEEEILDVVGLVALNQLTGSFNLIAGL